MDRDFKINDYLGIRSIFQSDFSKIGKFKPPPKKKIPQNKTTTHLLLNFATH